MNEKETRSATEAAPGRARISESRPLKDQRLVRPPTTRHAAHADTRVTCSTRVCVSEKDAVNVGARGVCVRARESTIDGTESNTDRGLASRSDTRWPSTLAPTRDSDTSRGLAAATFPPTAAVAEAHTFIAADKPRRSHRTGAVETCGAQRTRRVESRSRRLGGA